MQSPAETTDRLVQAYRERIAAVDERLIALYARRRELVREVFALKDRGGLARFDPEQEARVIARARRVASEIGGRPDEAERFARWILDQGREETARPAPSPRGPSDPVRVPVGSRTVRRASSPSGSDP